MSRKIKNIELANEERSILEKGFKESKSPQLSRRCHIILLKSGGRTSKEVATIFGITDQCVNNWVKRYESNGMQGLQTRVGQGRKPILNKHQDEQKVKAAVKNERQRLKLAKEALEKELNKEFSLLTLKRFLKNLSADGNASV